MYIRAVNIAILSDTLALLKFDLHREIIERTKNVPVAPMKYDLLNN